MLCDGAGVLCNHPSEAHSSPSAQLVCLLVAVDEFSYINIYLHNIKCSTSVTHATMIIFIAIFIAIALHIIVHIKSRHTSPLAIIHLLIALRQRYIITHNRHCLWLAAARWLAAFPRGTASVPENDWQLCLLYKQQAIYTLSLIHI